MRWMWRVSPVRRADLHHGKSILKGGNTPLHLAVSYLSKEMSHELIKRGGAKTNLKNRHLKTAKDYADENEIYTIQPLFSP
ncbi:MAG: ankyrin repeat domain-containing protein [Magnetococcales bacterium]|nr:ankyrin repeat domain-containing protein [Magnetococcales bacterium]